jgi:predicted PurR-regulated permease PerM
MRAEVSSSGLQVLRWFQYIVYGSLILYFGRSVFVPVSFALLVSFILYPICVWLEKKGLGPMTSVILSLSVLLILGLLIIGLAIFQFAQFVEEWPTLQSKLSHALVELSRSIEVMGFSRESQDELVTRISEQSRGNIFAILQSGLSASAVSIVMLLLIPVYVVLILYYRRYWMKILSKLFPHERIDGLREMISLTIQSYYNFIKGMAIVYIIVGALNSVGLLLLGVPYAILFGFIASILTFIPYVGIIAGSLLPMAMAWITYDSVWYPIGVVAIFTFVQYLEANVIFPVAVSNRLHVNTFVMLLAIFIGGLLWGMAGMILFVPFVGIAKLIADHNPNWKTMALILGTDTEV